MNQVEQHSLNDNLLTSVGSPEFLSFYRKVILRVMNSKENDISFLKRRYALRKDCTIDEIKFEVNEELKQYIRTFRINGD